MKLKTDEPYIPQVVLLKIEELKSILDEVNELYSPGTGTIVEYISPECILEGLNILQTANEVNSFIFSFVRQKY